MTTQRGWARSGAVVLSAGFFALAIWNAQPGCTSSSAQTVERNPTETPSDRADEPAPTNDARPTANADGPDSPGASKNPATELAAPSPTPAADEPPAALDAPTKPVGSPSNDDDRVYLPASKSGILVKPKPRNQNEPQPQLQQQAPNPAPRGAP